MKSTARLARTATYQTVTRDYREIQEITTNAHIALGREALFEATGNVAAKLRARNARSNTMYRLACVNAASQEALENAMNAISDGDDAALKSSAKALLNLLLWARNEFQVGE